MNPVSGSDAIVVSIICCTYNHENYIRDCLEGFVSQRTGFGFEVLIHDDASTDGTAGIIREYESRYPEIIRPVYQQTNQYSKGVDIFFDVVLPLAKGKYIAICEGDDYWTDPLKLRKQVDFLESHPDCGMVFGKVQKYIQSKKQFGTLFGSPVESVERLLQTNTIPTPTVLCRKDFILKYKTEIGQQQWLLGDYPLWIFIALHSEIAFMDEVLSVYRVLEESACHSKDYFKMKSFIRSMYDMKKFFIDKYALGNLESIEEDMNNALMSYAILLNAKDEAVQIYHERRSFSFRSFLKYVLCKMSLASLYKFYLRRISD